MYFSYLDENYDVKIWKDDRYPKLMVEIVEVQKAEGVQVIESSYCDTLAIYHCTLCTLTRVFDCSCIKYMKR